MPNAHGLRSVTLLKRCLLTGRLRMIFCQWQKTLLDQKNTELRGCSETAAILGDCVVPATEEDYWTEYGDYILAVKVVEGPR